MYLKHWNVCTHADTQSIQSERALCLNKSSRSTLEISFFIFKITPWHSHTAQWRCVFQLHRNVTVVESEINKRRRKNRPFNDSNRNQSCCLCCCRFLICSATAERQSEFPLTPDVSPNLTKAKLFCLTTEPGRAALGTLLWSLQPQSRRLDLHFAAQNFHQLLSI